MLKMELNKIPQTFEEGINPPEMRAVLPEILSNIPYVKLKERRNPDLRLYCVDGYYRIKKDNNKTSSLGIRMFKEYQAKSFEEAKDKAKEDGLGKELIIEQLLRE